MSDRCGKIELGDVCAFESAANSKENRVSNSAGFGVIEGEDSEEAILLFRLQAFPLPRRRFWVSCSIKALFPLALGRTDHSLLEHCCPADESHTRTKNYALHPQLAN